MTDTMNETTAGGINVTVDALAEKYREIQEIDEQLAAASGSTNLGKRALANSLTAENEQAWKEIADAVVSRINSVENIEVRVALVTGIANAVDKAFGKAVDDYLEAKVKENALAKGEKVSDEQIQALTEQARLLRGQFNALKEILVMFQQDVSSVPEPKRLSGARGKRGPRTLAKYNYSINGTPRTESQNNLSSISSTLLSSPVKVLKDLITEKGQQVNDDGEFFGDLGVDLGNPPERFGVMLPTEPPKKLVAYKVEGSDVYEQSDDDNPDDNSDDQPSDPQE